MEFELLKKLGMNENDIKAYMFLLKSGVSTAPEISKSTRIDKATVYRTLDNLGKMGYVSEVVVKNVKSFNAAPPHKLIDKVSELREELEEMVPELAKLTAIQRTTAQVELYQGKEGIKTVMQDILNEGKPYYIIGHAETFFEEVPIYCNIWINRIEKKKIKGELLCPKNEKFKIAKTEELRDLPKELTSLISTWIYGDKVAQFIMTRPAYVVLIHNKEVAESNKKLFEYIWKLTGKNASQ